MTITIGYKNPIRTLSTDGYSRKFTDQFIIFGAGEDYNAALQALKTFAPGSTAIDIDGIACYPVSWKLDEQQGSLWYATIEYSSRDLKIIAGNSSSYSFDIGFESEHRTHAEGDVKTYVDPNFADMGFFNAINVEKSGNNWNIRGDDFDVVYQNKTISKDISAGSVTDTLIDAWASIANHVNDGDFRGYKEKEVRFNGARGSLSNGNYRIEFSFSIMKSRTIQIGNIPAFDLKGWEKYWVLTDSYLNKDVGFVGEAPINATVYDRYPSADFSILNVSGQVIPYNGIVPGSIS